MCAANDGPRRYTNKWRQSWRAAFPRAGRQPHGASSAVGVDIDEWSYENARENVALNGLTGKVAVIQGELMSLHRRSHELIAANIHRTALEELLPEMAARLAEGGVLVLAGLLETDRGVIRTLLGSRGFRILEELQEHEWIGIAATQLLKSRCSL